MPVIRVTMMEGYDEATRSRLAERLTDALRSVVAAPLDGVTVVIDEVKPANYMRGRVARRPGPPLPDAETVVRDYLAAMEARDLDRARKLLDEDFEMTFPGGVRFTEPEQLVEWARSRYRTVRKSIACIETALLGDAIVVSCTGELAGEWPDGTAFSGIRFIDRFEVQAGRIRRQEVWNDLAEYRG